MGRDRNSPHTHTDQDKMLRLLAVVLAVSAAWGQECGECLPDSYQGIIGQSTLASVAGDVFPSVEGAFMARDATVNKAAGYINDDNGTPLTVVVDYNSQTLFVTETGSETCQKSTFAGSLENVCLENVQIGETFRLGGGGNSMDIQLATGTFRRGN